MLIAWQSRLHITLFVLFSAFVGVVFSQLSTQRIGVYAAIMLMLTSVFWVFYNDSRPIGVKDNIFNQPRIDQYFKIRGDLTGDYKEAVKFIKNQGCSKIGLSFLPDTWEYPFWVLFQKDSNPVPRLEHINIENISSIKSNQYPYHNFIPCAIISKRLGREEKIVTNNGLYLSKWSGLNQRDPVNVLMPENSQ